MNLLGRSFWSSHDEGRFQPCQPERYQPSYFFSGLQKLVSIFRYNRLFKRNFAHLNTTNLSFYSHQLHFLFFRRQRPLREPRSLEIMLYNKKKRLFYSIKTGLMPLARHAMNLPLNSILLTHSTEASFRRWRGTREADESAKFIISA